MPNPIPGSDDIQRRKLSNGIVILIRENFDAQSVVISGSFAAGATFEPANRRGLAGITAEGLMRGTKTHQFHDLHELLESGGMSLDFSGGRHTTSFHGKALGEDFNTLIETLGDTLINPTFPEAHIELIKGEVITSLRYYEQDTRYMASKTFQKLAYPENHIYHHGTAGTIESVSSITAKDLRDFHTRQYGPGNMIIAISGAVKAEDVFGKVEATLGSWQNPAQDTDWGQPEVPHLEESRHQLVTLPGKSQSDIVLGVTGPARTSRDFQAAFLANNILGVFGMYGRLGKSVREEQGLAYYSYSHMDGGLGQGAWRVSAGVNPANVKRAITSIRAEIERIVNEPVSEQDINDNKSNLIARLPLRLETNGGIAANLLNMERYDLGLDYLRNYAAEIDALTIEDLQNAVRNYWNPDAIVLAIAGPELEEAIL